MKISKIMDLLEKLDQKNNYLIELSRNEIALIHACIVFIDSAYGTMTKEAQKIFDRLEKNITKICIDQHATMTVWK